MSQFNPYLVAGRVEKDAWGELEVKRLKSMDELLTFVTREDLKPILEAIHNNTPGYLLDIGSGTGATVKKLCEQSNVTYIPLDANKAILEARGEQDMRIRAQSEALPLIDHSVDITYSRAVTAWSAKPHDAIAEQLRVTRRGGEAVFTEFDWSKSGPGDHSSAEEAELINRMRDTMLGVLQNLGFQPNYGAHLGADIDEVAREKGIQCERHEQIHEFPAGDHSELLQGVVGSLIAQVRSNPTGPVQQIANSLEADMIRFQGLEHHSFHIPALVTQRVSLV